MMEGTIMTVIGSTLLSFPLCHQRLVRRGYKLTRTKAKVMLLGADFIFCGVLAFIFKA